MADIENLSVELEAVAALLCYIGSPFQNGETSLVNDTLGSALFGIQRYVERINADVTEIAEGEIKKKK